MSGATDARLIDIACALRRETDKAFAVSETEDGPLIWLPKSQVEWHANAPGKSIGTMVMPEWLAKDKGLV